MPAWSLSGPILLALTAPAGSDRVVPISKQKYPLRVIDASRRDLYRMPSAAGGLPSDGQPAMARVDFRAIERDRRFDRPLPVGRQPIHDPQADCLKSLLRDRFAKRGGAIDARVEWHLTTAGDSSVGMGGGLVKAVENLLQD